MHMFYCLNQIVACRMSAMCIFCCDSWMMSPGLLKTKNGRLCRGPFSPGLPSIPLLTPFSLRLSNVAAARTPDSCLRLGAPESESASAGPFTEASCQ